MCQGIDDSEAVELTKPQSIEAAVERCLPSLERWVHSKLPPAARGEFDTMDLVQEAALRMLQRGDRFEPRHAQATHAYMRRTVLNLIRDEARRRSRRPESVELAEEEVPGERTGPVEFTVRREVRDRYEQALGELRPKDRRLVVAHVEEERSVEQIAHVFGLPSRSAARMAVTRAFNRLVHKLSYVK